MLIHLVDNAIRHSPPAGTVFLAVEYPDAELEMPEFWARFSVSDEGDGIPARLRPTLFDDFGALAVKGRKRSQSILGLSFCRRVVEAHGGRIYVTGNTPKGTVFTVEI
jgi:signal transduction histidine kinase